MHVFVSDMLDGVGNDDARVAKICETVNWTLYHIARTEGNRYISDSDFKPAEEFLPYHLRPRKRKPRKQTWGEMKANLGFA